MYFREHLFIYFHKFPKYLKNAKNEITTQTMYPFEIFNQVFFYTCLHLNHSCCTNDIAVCTAQWRNIMHLAAKWDLYENLKFVVNSVTLWYCTHAPCSCFRWSLIIHSFQQQKISMDKCQFSYKLCVKIIKTGMDNVPNVPIIQLRKIRWILIPNVSKFDLPWQTTSSIKR